MIVSNRLIPVAHGTPVCPKVGIRLFASLECVRYTRDSKQPVETVRVEIANERLLGHRILLKTARSACLERTFHRVSDKVIRRRPPSSVQQRFRVRDAHECEPLKVDSSSSLPERSGVFVSIHAFAPRAGRLHACWGTAMADWDVLASHRLGPNASIKTGDGIARRRMLRRFSLLVTHLGRELTPEATRSPTSF